ncbi:MAG: hypothetical protein P8Y96_06680 [Desulfuromonadales bacterium]
MPVSPPREDLLDQSPLPLMALFGRMRSLTSQAGFSGTLPVVWQCSDESQTIKKSLFGYVYDCPVFNLGRVGALLDPTRLIPAAHHGRDLVILGGSHLGVTCADGVGYVERVHGKVVPCCGMLYRLMSPYLALYRRAATLIRLFHEPGGMKIEIPYTYLLRKGTEVHDHPHLHLRIDALVEGEALREASQGKVFHLNPAIAKRYQHVLARITQQPVAIGSCLDASTFYFTKRLDQSVRNSDVLLEASLFDYLPDIVTAEVPHRRMADITTWRQFHKLAAYLTDSFDAGGRNLFVVAGLTLDHSIKRNTFVPQYGFWMQGGDALQARYFNAPEINELLQQQPIAPLAKTYLEYAEIG